MNSEYYCHMLQNMLPEMHNMSGEAGFIFQQDGARCHTSRQSIAFLHDNVPELVEPDMWPPNSPDLNPLDYCIWDLLQEMVWHNRTIRNLDELKAEITRQWDNIQQDVIDRAIHNLPLRINNAIAQLGGHFERYL